MEAQDLNWMPMIMKENEIWFQAKGLFEFMDLAIKKSNTPKREKEVLAKLKKVLKDFEKMGADAYNNPTKQKTYDA